MSVETEVMQIERTIVEISKRLLTTSGRVETASVTEMFGMGSIPDRVKQEYKNWYLHFIAYLLDVQR